MVLVHCFNEATQDWLDPGLVIGLALLPRLREFTLKVENNMFLTSLKEEFLQEDWQTQDEWLHKTLTTAGDLKSLKVVRIHPFRRHERERGGLWEPIDGSGSPNVPAAVVQRPIGLDLAG